MLAGKKILLAVTGSIAAYKIPLLVRLLVKAGAEVKLVMTPAAAAFVSPLTLGTLSRNAVLSELFSDATWANHVALGRWADLMLVAPLSCNTMAKMASGQCDNLMLAVYLSATCPVMAAPAMDEDMWLHPATKANIDTLRRHGVDVLEVGHGELASGLVGEGRMAEPEELLATIDSFFASGNQLHNKKALVTAGPTHESIDPVRFISNHSTGKMGFAIAEELAGRGALVTLVSGPVAIRPRHGNIELVPVTTAGEMHRQALDHTDYDIAVMAAAVADYTPEVVADRKIKKGGASLTVALKKTDDILAALGRMKSAHQVLIGFALETDNEQANAAQKLKDKNADMIVLNSLNDEGAGFGHDTNKVTLLYRDGQQENIALKSKTGIAKDIVDAIIRLKK